MRMKETTNILDICFNLVDQDEGFGVCFRCRAVQDTDRKLIIKGRCTECDHDTVYSAEEAIRRIQI